MKKLAIMNNGECLSATYLGVKIKLLWRCEHKHQWLAPPDQIIQGKWCKKCADKQRGINCRKYTIADLQKWARNKAGDCLSEAYINLSTKYRWKCHDGHEWEASWSNIFRTKSWCPYCSKYLRERKCRFIIETLTGHNFPKDRMAIGHELELDGYNEELNIAFEFNGSQHYLRNKTFHRSAEAFEKQKYRDAIKTSLCHKKGIRLITIPYWEADGKDDEHLINYISSQLPENLPQQDVNMSRFYCENQELNKIKDIVQQHGGRLLTNEYSGWDTKMICQCANGHTWNTRANYIKKGHWCPYCAKKIKYTIEYMQEIAARRGGKCLSTIYLGANTKLTWQCEKGHIWNTIPSVIMNMGCWCGVCESERRKSFFKNLQASKRTQL